MNTSQTQLALPLTEAEPPIVPRDRRVSESDVPRLTGQNERLYELLRQRGERGLTNIELAPRFMKYTSRISDVRKWLAHPLMPDIEFRGGDIVRTCLGGGVNLYRLVAKKSEVPR